MRPVYSSPPVSTTEISPMENKKGASSEGAVFRYTMPPKPIRIPVTIRLRLFIRLLPLYEISGSKMAGFAVPRHCICARICSIMVSTCSV